MKPSQTFNYCENCEKQILAGTTTEEAYENARINISSGSTVLLPDRVVKVNHKEGYADSHASSIDGIYCNLECLVQRLNNLLHLKPSVPRTMNGASQRTLNSKNKS